MIDAYRAQDVRAAETPLLEAGEPLMLRAAHALAGHVRAHLPALTRRRSLPARPVGKAQPRVLVLAGAGSNGGDGLHAAALLRRGGITADALAVSDAWHEEGARALREAGGHLLQLSDVTPSALEDLIGGADVLLDAIVGNAGRPEVPEALRPLLELVRHTGTAVIAVDLPSFLDATTGEAAPLALPATATVTFGAVKAGMLLPGGSELIGELHLVDLGLEKHLPASSVVQRLEDEDVRRLVPRPGREDSKYTRGVVALAAGSTRYPGAAVLACTGAARAGAGMVRCAAPGPVLDLVLRSRPEILGHPVPDAESSGVEHDGEGELADLGRTDALVVGPGMPPEDPRARAGIDLLRLDHEAPGVESIRRGVIDAGGLGAIEAAERFGDDVVLTPHRGEAERLAERLNLDPELPAPALARALAEATGATVLLKGAVTVVAPPDPDQPLLAQDDATPALATAGTGDVLAGILGTLLAAGLPGPEAAALAALLHGRAGLAASSDGWAPLVALDVADQLPRVLATILSGSTNEGER